MEEPTLTNVIRALPLALTAVLTVLAAPNEAGQQVRLAGQTHTVDARLQGAPVQLAFTERSDAAWQSKLLSTQQALVAAQQQRQVHTAAAGDQVTKAKPAAAAAAQTGTAPPPPVNLPPGSVGAIIAAAFAPYGAVGVAWGLAVARCESGLNPHSYNPAGYYGLFQFAMSTFLNNSAKAGYGYTSNDIWDATANARVAAYMYGQGQQHQWGCSR